MHYETKANVTFVAVCVVVIGLFIYGIDAYSEWQCDNYNELTGRDTKYINFDVCYVNVNDEWVRYDSNYRRVED